MIIQCKLSKKAYNHMAFLLLFRVSLQWHLGFFEKEYTPTYRGFETFYGFWDGKEDYWDHSSQEDVWGMDLRDNMKVKMRDNTD